jgi:hypothetical protein
MTATGIADVSRTEKITKEEDEKEAKEIVAMVRRRLPEILECIESELNK